MTTERLRLEPLGPEHGELLAALDGDPEVMRYITGRARSREEVLRHWVPVMSEEMGTAGLLGYWVGFEDDSVFVGWWCLTPSPDDPSVAELGYRLRRDHWGRGLASEGARALLEHGFATVGLARIWAQTMAVNTGSRAVMTAVGMSFARTWVGEWNEPLPGWEDGEVEYALTRDAWLSGRRTGQD